MRICVAALALLVLALGTPATAQVATGTILDPSGIPIAGASVRLSSAPPMSNPISSQEAVLTAEDGTFAAAVPEGPGGLYIGIGKRGYLNISGMLDTSGGLAFGPITLEPVPDIDNVAYSFVQPYFPKEDQSDFGCNLCHGEQYDKWKDSVMAKSATDPLVLSLYEGTDLDGNPAGAGYKLDHPDEAGPCANCHAPAAAIAAPGETDLSTVEGVAAHGVFCDVCHKVEDVVVGAGPGVGGSLVLYRPDAWTGLFAFGPFEDAFGMPMTTSYNPLLTESRMCAGCHEWRNEHDVPVLSTFSEWSEMSGADPDALQCQDCHMKKKFGPDYQGEPEPTLVFILDDQHQKDMHGVKRWSDQVFPHVFAGAAEYAEEAADVEVELAQDGNDLVVTATVENVDAGHALPTGMPFRHMILVVEATMAGSPLQQTGGTVVPDYGGEGDAPEDLAGRPGRGYARVLGDGEGGRNVPFWDATEVVEDTRIRAAEADERTFRFAVAEGGGAADVSLTLIYRRAFREMVVTKGWDVEDLVIGAASAAIDLEPPVVTDAPPPEDDGDDAGAETDPGGATEPGDDGGAASGDDGAAPEGDGWGGCGAGGGSPLGPLWPALLLLALALARPSRKRA